MNDNIETISVEDKHFAPFFKKIKISIERGEGVFVWDENGKKYLDFTSGWGVTSIGHANPVITEALLTQGKRIIQNPNSGLTYSPIRSKLLCLMNEILPKNLTRVFFTNSGAESNDAVIKLARKVSGKKNVISTYMSFHGRTISTASATGQSSHRDKYNPLMPNYLFVSFNDIDALSNIIKDDVAAVILEPIQGEGGVIVPSEDYLEKVSKLCIDNEVLLIMDEVQTGFCRTGPMFASSVSNMKIDFITMAKGIAGGFPFGAFAMSEEVSEKIDVGDHGGTYCGNPLGCAVSYAVIKYLLNNNIGNNVENVSKYIFEILNKWIEEYPEHIIDVRGKGLLIVVEFSNSDFVDEINNKSLNAGLLLNVTHGTMIRIFPALNITLEEAKEGLTILKSVIDQCAERNP
ncbi:MAG: aspartate aminotransferase family protein [Spirochaetota bacterium]|nr:aspartate aminotransferase family protein [Spirochaetota bacterium]